MLCSVPTGKSGGSNWLDRLRSSKGFPAGDDLDLDRFLSQNPNSSSSESTRPNPNPCSESIQPPAESRAAIPCRVGGRDRGLAGVVSNVLSELFFIGGSGENSELSGKKFPRKQTNPRLCVATSSNNVGTGNSNSSVQADQKRRKIKKLKKKKKKKTKNQKSSDLARKFSSPPVNSDSNSLTQANRELNEDDGDEEEEEQEDGENELKGYSRSEVTVIDTSFSAWKTEKLVFRKKNLWKIREKKGKARSFGRKKRKSCDVDEAGDLNPVEKRAKVSAELSLDNNGDQSVKKKPSLDEGQNLNIDSREEVSRAMADNLKPKTVSVSADSLDNHTQDFKKRYRFSSSLKKMKSVGSSTSILTKGIQTDRKITGKLSKNCSKLGTQKQHKT